MDTKPATERRYHFLYIVPSAYPVLIHPDVIRDEIVISNEGSPAIRIGHSGTVSTNGMYIGSGVIFTDRYSRDAWWAQAVTSSGTVSGFVAT